jgi:hypothetical protein
MVVPPVRRRKPPTPKPDLRRCKGSGGGNSFRFWRQTIGTGAGRGSGGPVIPGQAQRGDGDPGVAGQQPLGRSPALTTGPLLDPLPSAFNLAGVTGDATASCSLRPPLPGRGRPTPHNAGRARRMRGHAPPAPSLRSARRGGLQRPALLQSAPPGPTAPRQPVGSTTTPSHGRHAGAPPPRASRQGKGGACERGTPRRMNSATFLQRRGEGASRTAPAPSRRASPTWPQSYHAA